MERASSSSSGLIQTALTEHLPHIKRAVLVQDISPELLDEAVLHLNNLHLTAVGAQERAHVLVQHGLDVLIHGGCLLLQSRRAADCRRPPVEYRCDWNVVFAYSLMWAMALASSFLWARLP